MQLKNSYLYLNMKKVLFKKKIFENLAESGKILLNPAESFENPLKSCEIV